MTNTVTSAKSPLKCFALFISDLHLCPSRPEITDAFVQFLESTAPHAEHLYILGDFFEYWAGDDDKDDPFHLAISNALNTLSQTGTSIYFMHGNRDFLIGESYAQSAGFSLLSDPTCIQYQNQSILLSHGDALCTDDTAYQEMRKQFRDPAWQEEFLSQPLSARKAQIEAIRQQSKQAKSNKSMMIMDVNLSAVETLLQSFHYPRVLIHGHTHRPNTHEHQFNGHKTTRYVLGDWYSQGSYLSLSETGFTSYQL